MGIARITKQMPQNRSSVVLSGSDIITALQIPSSVKIGRVLLSQQISPRLMQGTRLALQASAWQNWKPISMKFRFQGAAPTTAAGQLAVAWAADEAEYLPTNPTAILRKMGSFSPNALLQLWETRVLTLNKKPYQRMLFTDPSHEDSRFGELLAVVVSGIQGFSGSVSVMVTLDWVVRFENPDLPSQQEVEEAIVADEGYYPYFTSYSTHLTNADRLTIFSSTNGGYGNIARFSEALPDTIYVPVKEDALKYYSSSSNEKYVAALVRMKEVPDPLMWCFANINDAKDYVKASTVSSVIKWTKDGDWTTGNPLWKHSASLSAPPPSHTPCQMMRCVRVSTG